MTTSPSIWSFISNASFVVQCVMLLLCAASISSWTIIFNRLQMFKATRRAIRSFTERFWSGSDLHALWQQVDKDNSRTDLALIFHAGMREYQRLLEQPDITTPQLLHATERAMRIALTQESEKLEKHLTMLATIGSTSPYVGLFGTVWGIMTAFQALGGVQQASIAMVAPGISEALIATAIGLFAAIPAVIAYNRFSNQLEQIHTKYSLFQEELLGVLQHHV